MDVSVGEPPDAAGIIGLLDLSTATLRADIEINPPHSDAASECHDESGQRGPGPLELGERRAGDEYRFAKRDNKRPQRSARWPPSMAQSVVSDRPSPGTKKPTASPEYSMASATAHSPSLGPGAANPPKIQNSAETESQIMIR